jgi:soluble lytic murein transglycosylase-like protein
MIYAYGLYFDNNNTHALLPGTVESDDSPASIQQLSDGSDHVETDSDDNKECLEYVNNISDPRIPPAYREVIHNRANAYRIEPSLVSAVITVESNWNSKAVSRKGAIGLMQLMPSTANEMGINDPFNPTENIEGGIKYLRYLLDRFDGDIALAIAAYNAGPRRIVTFRGIPPIRETQQYVNRVLSIYYDDSDSI